MSTVVHALDAPGRLRRLQRFVADNPALILVVVLVALLVITDLINRHQTGSPFVTWKQLSTTFLVAALLGLIAGGQTLVMLTGGVDLSIAYIATAAAYVTAWQGQRDGHGPAVPARHRRGDRARERRRRRASASTHADHDARRRVGALQDAVDLREQGVREDDSRDRLIALGTERFFGTCP